MILLLLALVASAGAGGWFWRQRPIRLERSFWRAVQEARSIPDRPREFALLRDWLDGHPNDLAAWRRGAELLQAEGLPLEMEWRREIARLSPTDGRNRWRLLQMAALRQDGAGLREAMRNFPEGMRREPEFHNIAAALAMAEGHWEPALDHAREAVLQSGGEPALARNLATLLLAAPASACHREAVALLQDLAQRPETARTALEMLCDTAPRHGDRAAARAAALLLTSRPDRTAADWLRLADAEESPASADRAVAEALVLARDGPLVEPLRVAHWMMNRERAAWALRWLEELPESSRATVSWQATRADLWAADGRWADLVADLRERRWDDREYLRHALLGRAWLAMGRREAELAAREARRLALASSGPALHLAELWDRWSGWETERVGLLWEISAKYSLRAAWALQEILGVYQKQQNTAGLLRAVQGLRKWYPHDYRLGNNQLYYSILLRRDPALLADLARELRQDRPDDPVITATYALYLFRSGRREEALDLLRGLPAELFQQPGFALTRGILLAEAGLTEEAAPHLARVQAAVLLPEEQALLLRARQAVGP